MMSSPIVELLKQVITSWQVIAVTVGILIYLNIVFYVSRSHRRPSITKMGNKKKKVKAEAVPTSNDGPEETKSSKNTNDELGLEEE